MFEGLQGKRAVVCGGSRGIGRAIAEALVNEGVSVVILGRDHQSLEEASRVLGVIGVSVDLCDLDATARAAEEISVRMGDVHILVNNSGGPEPGPLLKATTSTMMRVFTQHVLASHVLAQHFVPGMERLGYGRIINIVSTSVREPIHHLGVSNTVRAAMGGWSKTLSKELAPGITINNILPGFTKTDRLEKLCDTLAKNNHVSPESILAGWTAAVPEHRLAEPLEIAALAVFLASPSAAYMRGTSIAVDGGRTQCI